jgi:cellulase/cellobiase CelA1/pimeloyl-ACP methyl ester carboxylesterase
MPSDNPFIGAVWYVDPIWSAKANSVVGGEKISGFNTAVWMDRIGAIAPTDGSFGLRDHLDAALAQKANLIQVVVYDLPNRDCHALASNGELTQGANGTVRYRTEYVDALAAIFSDSKYRSLRIIAIIEPDSLPNLVTNLNDPECQLATDATNGYVANTQYTLNKFYSIPNVYSYVDIGHSGWLGWDDNFAKSATLLADAIKGTTNGVRSIAGFVSNTSGYTPIYEPFLDSLASSALPGSGGGTQVRQAKFYEWNPKFSEVAFVQAWRTKMIAAGFPASIGMLIDTSRNGWGGASRPTAQSTSTVLDTFVDESRVDRRQHRGNWCNQPGGIGERPQAAPAPGIDAYVWVKPPGESDGASSLELSYDPLDPAKGFDRMCDPSYTIAEANNAGTGALANAPVAGRWFPEAFQLLVKNAYPPLDAGASSSALSSSSVRSSSSSVVVVSSIASSSVPSSSVRSSSVQSSSIASSSLVSSSSVISSSKSSSSLAVISSSSVATSSSSSSLPDVVRTDCPAAPPTTQFGSWAPYNTNDESQKVVTNYRDLMVKMPVFDNGVIPLPYNLHQPAQAAANPQAKYPLVIYLHGGGERGSNEEHLSSRHALPFFASSNSLLTPQNLVNKPTYIVAPQCNCDFYSNEWSSGGGAPFSVSGSPSRYGKALTDLIENLVATYQIDRDRIYVTGISMGGGGAWELAARRPDLIAAAIPMSGYPVSTNHAQAVANSKVVIWPQQGDGDENNSISGTQTTVSAIAQAQGCAYMNTFPRGTTLEVDPGDPPNGNDLQHTVWMRAYMNPQLWDYVFSIKRAHTGVISSSLSSSSSSIRSSSSSQLSSVLSSSKSSSSAAVISSVISSSIRSSSSVAVISSAPSSASSSSIADRNLYTARKAQVAPVIDGTADAVWEQASWAPINVFWLGTQANPSAADYTGQYKALWDANYLYLLFDITDDRIYDGTRDPLSNYWEDDTVELFIDENKNGGQHQYNTSAWAYHVSTYGDVVDYTTSGPKLLNDHIDVRRVSVGDKHMWEMRVRIYGENYSDSQVNTPLTLTAGKLMGFSASYIDNDGSAQRESMMGSVDTAGHKNNQGYLDASAFGSLKLVE